MDDLGVPPMTLETTSLTWKRERSNNIPGGSLQLLPEDHPGFLVAREMGAVLFPAVG